MTRTLTALAAAAAIAVATMAPTDADARGRRGGAFAAGIFGGLAAGALLGSAYARGYPAPYAYYGAGPYYYGPRCFWTRERVWTGYHWRLARVRVCD